ncbi:MAG: hypothetical protein HC878_15970 [Leptolyngbyaceae cyanobacterium SL_5_14]|nr:hypothetical protein [Leptolyngbyaceae cyanobacterium SL_5_14]
MGAIGGAIQLTTPVQRIDRSRLGLSAKPWATADRERYAASPRLGRC